MHGQQNITKVKQYNVITAMTYHLRVGFYFTPNLSKKQAYVIPVTWLNDHNIWQKQTASLFSEPD